METIRVTVWNEYLDERRGSEARAVYPRGIHECVADALRADPRFAVTTATLSALESPDVLRADAGLPDSLLAATDVLVWWGHSAHEAVSDDRAAAVTRRVLDGMGFVALHSGLYSKPMQALVGTRMCGRYREAGERERVWVLEPSHPICDGLADGFVLDRSEMYGEPTGLAAPDTLLFVSWFAGGEVFRSGGCYARGRGRVFYFTPGHEDYPTYYQPEVRRVLQNACAWSHHPGAPVYRTGNVPPLEPPRG